jgi:hypothetical protein
MSAPLKWRKTAKLPGRTLAMEIVGSVGVALLLGAFFANLTGWLTQTSRIYQGLNVAGAAIAAYASYMIDFFPFVVLELTWCLVALVYLLRPRAKVPEPDDKSSTVRPG